MKKTREAEEQEAKKKEQVAAPVAPTVRKRKGKTSLAAPALIDVRVHCRAAASSLPGALSLTYTDATLSAREAQDALARKVRQEAYDAFLLKGHPMVGAATQGGKVPTEKLLLDVNVDVAWTFKRDNGLLLPQGPCVARCSVTLRRVGKESLWQPPQPYRAEMKGPAPSQDDLARIAKLEGVAPGINFAKYSDRDAAEVARTVFHLNLVPNRAELARMLETDRKAETEGASALLALDKESDATKARELAKAGNPYVLSGIAKRVDTLDDLALLALLTEKADDPELAQKAAYAYVTATGSLPPGERQMRLKNPYLLLMGPLRKKFLGTEHSFADVLPFLEATRESAPHVVLAFARTALQMEEEDSRRRQLERLCTLIEATRAGIARHESEALETLGREQQTVELGRQALLALLQSGRSLAEQPAMMYITAVAAGIVPDVETPWADGSLRLSKTQMEILDSIAQCDRAEGSDAAVGLLLRVGGEQRDKVREYVKYPPPTRDSSKQAIQTIQNGTPKDVVALLRRLPKHGALYPVSEYLADAYYRYTHPKVAIEDRVAVLVYLTFVGRRPNAYSDTMVRLAGSENVRERRVAAGGLLSVASIIPELPEQLKPLIAKETDPQVKAQLQAVSKKSAKSMDMHSPGRR
jgi:hypothetical protein